MSSSDNDPSQPLIFVLHENTPWVEPLRREFAAIGAPFSEWFLDRGLVDLTSAPPEGIFYNRMSASSHTRGHRYAPEYTAAVLAWLTKHGRTIVNGERALQLEISKVAQYESLARFGIETPATIATIGREHIPRAAAVIGYPVILKHNRAGKGLGVKLIYSEAALQEHLASEAFEDSVDGIMLVQRYIKAPEPFITRVEFIHRRFASRRNHVLGVAFLHQTREPSPRVGARSKSAGSSESVRLYCICVRTEEPAPCGEAL
jgi:hypothetical protein